MLLLNIINQQVIKETNKTRILKLISEKKEITIKDIAKKLSISIPTVISNVNSLVEIGIVSESRVAKSSGGRKPVILEFLPNSRFCFGVNISPKKADIALMNLNAKILLEKTIKCDDHISFQLLLTNIFRMIEDIIEVENINRNKILGVGFSLPGIVDEENLILEIAPNINVKDFDFKPYVEQFQFPIYIENEANAAAIGEAQLGINSRHNNLVFISITEGIGTGIIIQKHLYKSTNKRAGEFGHMRISDANIKCNCGRFGCWEMFASETALINSYNEKTDKHINTVSDLIMKVKDNEELACTVFNHYLSYLAIGIENIILTLSPERIIIGGKISKYHKLFEKTLIEFLNRESVYPVKENIITYSILKGKASLLGAGLLNIDQLIRTGASTL